MKNFVKNFVKNFAEKKAIILRYVIAALIASNGWVFYNSKQLNSKKDSDTTPEIENTIPKDSLDSRDRFHLEKLRKAVDSLNRLREKNEPVIDLSKYDWVKDIDTTKFIPDSTIHVKTTIPAKIDTVKAAPEKSEEKEGFWKKLFSKEDTLKQENQHKRQK